MSHTDEEVEELLRAAVHDARGPVNQLRALTGLLLSKHGESLGQDGRELCAFIDQAASRAAGVMDAIHAYAKALSPIAIETVDMNEVFEAARAPLTRMIERRSASVKATGLGCARADRAAAVQLFSELIANGIKFNRSERPDIRVSTAAAAGQVVYSVADNGIGIPPERAEAVFKPFKRLNGFEYEGAGIGLAIAKRIAEAHGGRIWLEPSGCGGSVVRFTLQRGPEHLTGAGG